MAPAAWTFWLPLGLALVTGVTVPLHAARVRGRPYAIFAAVLLALSLPAALWLQARLTALWGAAAAPGLALAASYGVAATAVHLLSLIRARLRSSAFRLAVSVPGQAFVALGALSLPWLAACEPLRALATAAGAARGAAALAALEALPVAIVAVSLVTSLRLRREVVRIELGGDAPAELVRLPVARRRAGFAEAPARRPLRLVQIADPHLGPWQPEPLLRRRIESLLRHEPDLVLLTGDFLTMEGNGTPGALARALAPLAAMQGRCFAVFGNHDHEAPEEVRAALAANGVRLLEDESVCVATPIGPVQLVGADWYREERRAKLHALLAAHPRLPDALRLLLLHDPLGFRDLPHGDVDLVLSGHTHGGQVGLLSLGLDWTVLSRSRWPDHGLFGLGRSRLYVHRGTGFYGFPLRIGVPGELSLLEVVPAAPC